MLRRVVLVAPIILLAAAFDSPAFADGPAIAALETLQFAPPKEKGRVELVPGHVGKAVQFSFDEKSSGAFATSRIRGTPEWDQADGFSFWVHGDGSRSFGGLEFIYDDDYAVRYDYMFSIESREWTKITVAWRDLIPVLPGKRSRPLAKDGANRPSKLSSLWIGKWWYWGAYPAHSFALDEFRLEAKIARDSRVDTVVGGADPLARVVAKLRDRKPITIVTMGDSLTDYRHWANRDTAWPKLLAERMKKKYGSEVTIINPAIGGTQLRQNLVLMPRWLREAPKPDLVTVCFGGNDYASGMRGPEFYEANLDAIERIRRATDDESDVLLMTTVPSVERWEANAEMADACRRAASQSGTAPLVDVEAAFLEAGKTDKEKLFVRDKVHLSPTGHETIVEAIMARLAGEM